MPLKITGVKTKKHEGRGVLVRFIEKGTDEMLFGVRRNLIDDQTDIDIINCQIENVNGMAKLTIPLIATAETKSS